MNPPISVLTVCYNSETDVVRCLASLYRYVDPELFEVVLINNSPDDTEAIVRARFPAVRVLPSQGNIGFGPANNVCAKHATGDYLLLLNPDTELQDDALSPLLKLAREYPSAAAWGGVTVLPNESVDPSCLQVAPSLLHELNILTGWSKLSSLISPPITTQLAERRVLSGAFMMVERNLWNEVEGFDESFFLYSEEVDLCARLCDRRGAVCLRSPDARLVHYVGSSSPSSMRGVYINRGKMHFAWKRKSRAFRIVLLNILILQAASRGMLQELVRLAKRKKPETPNPYFVILMQISQWKNGYNDF
ncbi:glycosyltransferase family 2 protein [Allohahella marinimesophila]|uniref:glycosyltransferase family 2 protein n=1 Tax=Allohahella marinimesophila TaxID=1054972 RepID=UPI003CD093A5